MGTAFSINKTFIIAGTIATSTLSHSTPVYDVNINTKTIVQNHRYTSTTQSIVNISADLVSNSNTKKRDFVIEMDLSEDDLINFSNEISSQAFSDAWNDEEDEYWNQYL